MSRLTRKNEHLIKALELSARSSDAGFGDVTIVHNALPETSLDLISLKTQVFEKTLAAPLIINAITGGGAIPGRVNEALAVAARETGIAMAVGSQAVAIDNSNYARSFRVVRKINPAGMIMANVGAYLPLEQVKRAIEMINANALQIHLNAPQEITMSEGDTDFRGWINNISRIVNHLEIPVIVKEVGFGLSYEVVRRLAQIGVKNFDIGGRGGTNFIAIENHRGKMKRSHLNSWGLSTVTSLIETDGTGVAENIIATGGIRSPLEIVKSLALGARIAGISGGYLRILCKHNVETLIESIERTKKELSRIMLMIGVNKPSELKQIPVVISGTTREWLNQRGIETEQYAQRGRMEY